MGNIFSILFVLFTVFSVSTAYADSAIARIIVRQGATVATSSDITFDTLATTTIQTSNGTQYNISASSTLAVLASLDSVADEFNISDLQYNAGYGSFYVKCITVPNTTPSPACDNWQYQVNGSSPSVGMDKYSLSNNDTVYVYFASPRRTILSANSVATNTPLTATAQNYNPSNDSYTPVAGLTLGVTQADPNNPWTPIEIATSTSDISGNAIFTLNATGTYSVGIKEDYYFPSVSLTVVEPAPAPITTVVSGGGGSAPTKPIFDMQKAIQFLTSKQNADGSFADSLLTDWVAVAFANYDGGDTEIKLREYLTKATPIMQTITDYERHAMALESVNINPYNGTHVDYIDPIIQALQNTSTPLLDNGYIFAAIALGNAGYSYSDDVLRATVEKILSAQKQNGSWENNADMTSAAIQALLPHTTATSQKDAIQKAITYLQSTQKTNGSWDNIDSTSWTQTMINGLKNFVIANNFVSASGNTPMDFIATSQKQDGSIGESEQDFSRVWSTAYAVASATGKSWLDMPYHFTRPTAYSGASSDTSVHSSGATATTTIAQIATSTPDAQNTATSTATTTDSTTNATSTIAIATQRAITTANKATKPTKRKLPTKPISAPSVKTAPIASQPTSTIQTATAINTVPTSWISRMWHAFIQLF